MAKLYINPGIDTYLADLTKLFNESEEICKRSAYMGAKIVADRCRSEISNIPVESEKQKRANGGFASGLTGRQKSGLLSGLGISHFRNDGGMSRLAWTAITRQSRKNTQKGSRMR